MKTKSAYLFFLLAFCNLSAEPPVIKPAYVPPTQEEIDTLLKQRLSGELGHAFRGFANQFVVQSSLELGSTVGLVTADKSIAQKELIPVYPSSYKPTFRELLDLIALQTSSQWAFDPSGKHVENSTDTVSSMPIFVFTPIERKKTFQVDLAKEWTSKDMGPWVMYMPPPNTFPVGMDIYECGKYSFNEGEADGMKAIRDAVALQWANRVKEGTQLKEMKDVKVGEYGALHFQATIPDRAGGEIVWRQWIFTAHDTCYFIVSTLPENLADKVLPDVESMLLTFKVAKTE